MATLHAEISQSPVPMLLFQKRGGNTQISRAGIVLSSKVVTMGKRHCIDTSETPLPLNWLELGTIRLFAQKVCEVQITAVNLTI